MKNLLALHVPMLIFVSALTLRRRSPLGRNRMNDQTTRRSKGDESRELDNSHADVYFCQSTDASSL
ncbi:MAG: hypothetical protein KatS3mg054_1009 [Chloroflexus sp.]|nr:MAG: hypothetical protein KatS3mg054_1009 [Chloroflexus sp.]